MPGISRMTKFLARCWTAVFFAAGCGVGNQTNTTTPIVTITSPDPGVVSGTVAFSADAQDAFGIGSVKFKVDGNLLFEDFNAPYTTNWGTMTVHNGLHALSVEATDLSGNKSSTAIQVDVENGPQ